MLKVVRRQPLPEQALPKNAGITWKVSLASRRDGDDDQAIGW